MMKKRGAVKALLGTVAVVLFSVLAVGFSATTAEAYQGGNGGGGSGGGGGGWVLPSGWIWNYSDSLADFQNVPGMSGNAEGFVRASSGGDAVWTNYCSNPNLVRIYWIQNASGNIAHMTSPGLALDWSRQARPNTDAVAAYASTLNANGIYVICVINAAERRAVTEYETRYPSLSESITGRYSYSTAVAPEILNGAGEDAIGAVNLNAQTASAKSPFGELYDSISSSGTGDYAAKAAEIRAAIAAEGTGTRAEVTLNSENRAGLAEGGVLNVNEFSRNATVGLSQTWQEARSRTLTCDYQPGTNNLASPSNCVYSPWIPWSEQAGTRTHAITKNMGTQPSTGFWQILSVHCNPDELAAALSAYGREGVDYTVVSQTHTDKGVTAVINTSPKSARPTGANAQIFGVRTNANAALARTGQVGFYDKECSLQCTSAAGPGATAANGAASNVSNTGNLQNLDELGGATSGGTISNYFEMFRDNKARSVQVNVAYPNVTGTPFSYDGAAPISTTVTTWNDPAQSRTARLTIAEGAPGYPAIGGTPDTSAPGGQLNVKAVRGSGAAATKTELFTGSVAPVTQTNFSRVDAAHPLNTYSGPYATQLAGMYRNFEISSTWASLANQPVILNVKWEYQPTTATTVPGVVGYSSAGVSSSGGNVSIAQPIDVRCYATYGAAASNPSGYVAKTETGTGVANNVDRNVLNASALSGNVDSSAHRTGTNLVVKFVRGVSE